MADSTTETLESKPPQPEPEAPNPQPDPQPQSSTPPPSSTSTPIAVNPNLNTPPPPPPAPLQPQLQPQHQPQQVSYVAPPPVPQVSGGGGVVMPPPPPSAPSFRPVPQFSPIPNYQNPGVQPPGVAPMMQMPPYQMQQQQQQHPGQPMRPYAPPPQMPMPNGYPGLPRYPSPYPAMVRPTFPMRLPGAIGVPPIVSRPPIPGVPGVVRPIISPVIRPAVVPTVTSAEKPQTTVYIGKIASTVDNDFMLSLLKLCGPVKSWKRAQDPTDGTPKGFGFCEFESAEGVLRALRLLSKFNIDGQELVLNVNQATKEYLERYVDKQTENSKKLKDAQAAAPEKEEGSAVGVEKSEHLKADVENSNKEDNSSGSKENHDFANFGIVTDEDKDTDREAVEKLTSMIEERLKTRPLPPPPPPITDGGSGNSNSDVPAKSRDGDSEMRNDAAEDKNDDETTSETKPTSEHDRPETSSPDRNRKYERSRDRDRERDLKREKDREIDRYERETERERVRKEREQRRKIEEAERKYEECLKEWEYRERDKEKQRQNEKDREKERERKRKKEIKHDEEDEDEDSKRWRRRTLEEKRKKRLREKEEDLADRRKEEEEIADAKRRAEEELQQKLQRDALKVSSNPVMNGVAKTVSVEPSSVEMKENAVEQDYEGDPAQELHTGDGVVRNGTGEESTTASVAVSDTRHTGNAPAKKLGFGLVGSGKRTAVPSVFHEEEDDDAHKDKKMRPLVPIDYSTEELEAVQPTAPGAPPSNLVAATEFAKRISNVNPKEDKFDAERERSRRSNDKSSQRDRDRGDEDVNRTRDENKEKSLDRDRDRGQGMDKLKTSENTKLLSLKQLIDMIPRTKEELFSYEVNWAVYDKHELHERMRPWISKKITEFLGEEETTLVDYIVSSTQEHVKATQMLELLQSILDDEAEMFVLKMWRMLIYEIKRVEAGLISK
ncbi:RNA-binding motif protein 25 [Quercus robur]|uniref:RNA-binding motif protein 25 n=1 Tax=Quercus robur TaxID=38942 RepID=UPI002162FD5B|nr:RNA-binding motif protein 25 [Quercus robur]